MYLLAFLYVLVRIFDNYLPSGLQIFLNFAGGLWFAVISYLLLFTLIFYILYLLHVISKKFFETSADIKRIKFYYIMSSLLFILVILMYGFYNAVTPRIRTFEIATDKKLPSGEMTLVVVSDIHLGYLIGREEADFLKDSINSLKPDMVLIPGDIVDGEIGYIIENDSGRPLAGIKSRYGVFASMGNHDYFGGPEVTIKYITGLGIRMVIEESVTVADVITVIGRNDVSAARRNGFERKPLKDIMSHPAIDGSRFTILMDHQPADLNDAFSEKIDLQLSGHTHNGQFWPYNLVVNMIFELPWGYLRKGTTSYFVSCGYGTWGPRIRIGSQSEIIVLKIRQK